MKQALNPFNKSSVPLLALFATIIMLSFIFGMKAFAGHDTGLGEQTLATIDGGINGVKTQ